MVDGVSEIVKLLVGKIEIQQPAWQDITQWWLPSSVTPAASQKPTEGKTNENRIIMVNKRIFLINLAECSFMLLPNIMALSPS